MKPAESRCEAIIEGITPMLDLIDLESSIELVQGMGGRTPRPDAIIHRC